CRKRRIKCGEERPTCKNCTKSKRECEGYIPRVVFKEPAGASGAIMQAPFFAQQDFGVTTDPVTMFADGSAGSAEAVPYPPIAPRPSMGEGPSVFGPVPGAGIYWAPADPHPAAMLSYGNQSYPGPVNTAAPSTLYHPPSNHPMALYPNPHHGTSSHGYEPSIGGTHSVQAAAAAPPMAPTDGKNHPMNMPAPGNSWPYSPESITSQMVLPSPAYGPSPFGSADLMGRRHSLQPALPNPIPPQSRYRNSRALSFSSGMSYGGGKPLGPVENQPRDGAPQRVPPLHSQPQGPFTDPARWGDEWWDLEPEDEEDLKTHSDTSPPAELAMMIAMSAQKNNGNIRSLDNFLTDPTALAAYNPSYVASPLRDAQTARIFCHFITSTGPTLHVFDRQPSNPAVIFSGRPVPKSQQSLWSYTMPMLALHRQGLLHAMLALSSLHMAKLQQGSQTPSLRHYHYALRRVAKALGNEKQRRDPATLAATLLLGYYEVSSGEHSKWNSHLSGARQLVTDFPFAAMRKRVEAYRCKQEELQRHAYHRWNDYGNGHVLLRTMPHTGPVKLEGQLDRGLISTLMGWETGFDNPGEILEGNESSWVPPEEALTAEDVNVYETQLDLFWWYAKQDMYQSIISGNRLLLSYERWVDCPPRAPVGKLDAVYGSMDHLQLLMARLAEFASKDLARKKRAANEVERRAKALRQSPPSSNHTSPSDPPPMYGMIPDPGPVRLPHGFDQARHDEQYIERAPSESKPLDAALSEAQAEWSAIAQAFDVYHQSLGPSYEPLSPEHMTPLSTPFGPAIYYRSYTIACVHCLYYCGRIILTRVQPSMPPAAMAAAGVAAPHTASYANTIGRICAGIQPASPTAPLNPHHGAALLDVCMGLFFAGIQYQDPAQRGWTITKLRDVARLTGWPTPALIASGCERSWVRAAELGRGPPYERTMSSLAKDDRVAGRSRDPRFLADRPRDSNDRRFAKANAGTRVYWAMGILSVEEDMQDLNLGDS
ncbi:MAG: hypothetical protein Q9163_006435, partial [Psora crenata]